MKTNRGDNHFLVVIGEPHPTDEPVATPPAFQQAFKHPKSLLPNPVFSGPSHWGGPRILIQHLT